MTDRAQFEAMLEALINEDQETAKEIFHNIVVAKSREIYEELLAEDFEEPTSGQEAVEEEGEEEAMPVEGFGEEEEEGEEEEGEEEEEGGAEDEFGGEEEEGEDMSDDEQTDRILDLEDALEELKAEFEQLMADEENEPEHHDGVEDPSFGADEFGGEEEELEGMGMPMMEYVNKVGGATYDKFGKMGDDGANTKSIVAGKNDMGGTTANIAKSFSTEKGGTQGGLLNPSTKVEDFGNINKPGANAGKTAFKKKEPGHGAEKKGSAEQADNKQSLLKQAKK